MNSTWRQRWPGWASATRCESVSGWISQLVGVNDWVGANEWVDELVSEWVSRCVRESVNEWVSQ